MIIFNLRKLKLFEKANKIKKKQKKKDYFKRIIITKITMNPKKVVNRKIRSLNIKLKRKYKK